MLYYCPEDKKRSTKSNFFFFFIIYYKSYLADEGKKKKKYQRINTKFPVKLLRLRISVFAAHWTSFFLSERFNGYSVLKIILIYYSGNPHDVKKFILFMIRIFRFSSVEMATIFFFSKCVKHWRIIDTILAILPIIIKCMLPKNVI